MHIPVSSALNNQGRSTTTCAKKKKKYRLPVSSAQFGGPPDPVAIQRLREEQCLLIHLHAQWEDEPSENEEVQSESSDEEEFSETDEEEYTISYIDTTGTEVEQCFSGKATLLECLDEWGLNTKIVIKANCDPIWSHHMEFPFKYLFGDVKVIQLHFY